MKNFSISKFKRGLVDEYITRRQVLRDSFLIGVGLSAGPLLSACARITPQPPVDKGVAEEVFTAMGTALQTTGKAFTKIDSLQAAANAFDLAGEAFGQASDRLGALHERDPNVQEDLVTAYVGVGDLMTRAAKAARNGELSGLIAPMSGFASFVRYHRPAETTYITTSIQKSASAAGKVVRSVKFATDPAVFGLAKALSEIRPAEYEEMAAQVRGIELPFLRKVLLLDMPETQAAFDALLTPEGASGFRTFAAAPAATFKTAGIRAFVESMQVLGTNLLDTGTILAGAIIFLFALAPAWEDECSPEGAKQNCTPGFPKFVTAGQTPESEENLLEFANKLPYGKLATKAGVLGIKSRVQVDVFLPCEHEVCEDTPCVPWVDYNLEWVEAEEPGWIQVKNISTLPGSNESWPPIGAWARTDVRDFQRALQRTSRECTQCQF